MRNASGMDQAWMDINPDWKNGEFWFRFGRLVIYAKAPWAEVTALERNGGVSYFPRPCRGWRIGMRRLKDLDRRIPTLFAIIERRGR
jgi:hypothetical protein